MNNVISFFISKLWFIIPSVFILGIIFTCKRISKGKLVLQDKVKFIFLVYIICLSAITIVPNWTIDNNGFRIVGIVYGIYGNMGFLSRINLIPFTQIMESWDLAFNQNFGIIYFISNIFGNIILFIPLGFALPLLWNISVKSTIIYCFVISLFIEILQLPFLRGSDIDDVILNCIGGLIGCIIYKLVKIFMFKHKINKNTNI